MAEDDADQLEDEGEAEEEEPEDDEEEDDGEAEEDDDEAGDRRKTLLLFASYGVLIFFILTDPSGAAKLGRNLGGFLGDQAEAAVEFLEAALSDSPSRLDP